MAVPSGSGPEFISKEHDRWAWLHGLELDISEFLGLRSTTRCFYGMAPPIQRRGVALQSVSKEVSERYPHWGPDFRRDCVRLTWRPSGSAAFHRSGHHDIPLADLTAPILSPIGNITALPLSYSQTTPFDVTRLGDMTRHEQPG
jgi:hypothetical protein